MNNLWRVKPPKTAFSLQKLKKKKQNENVLCICGETWLNIIMNECIGGSLVVVVVLGVSKKMRDNMKYFSHD